MTTNNSRVAGFNRSVACVIGIDNYYGGVPPLRTAANDARSIADSLRDDHGFEVFSLLDEQALLEGIRAFLKTSLAGLNEDDRALFYFAGHGVALDGDDGPEGFIVAQNANRSGTDGFMPMAELREILSSIPCRHSLVILDCCFAGAFRWSATRHLGFSRGPLHKERYEWYIKDQAWQVITSASHNQRALDVVAGDALGNRGDGSSSHSPFATALLDALRGQADTRGKSGGRNGCVTATEIYIYIRERLETSNARIHQTPGLWHLPKHQGGEFVFLTPGAKLALDPAPNLIESLNPWRGLNPYTESDATLFFGRRRVADALAEKIANREFTIVIGPSGSGKSSLVSAGAVPILRTRSPQMLIASQPLRLSQRPFHDLSNYIQRVTGGGTSNELDAEAVISVTRAFVQSHPASQILIFIDQFEELLTNGALATDIYSFLEILHTLVKTLGQSIKICCTLRSDYEGALPQSSLSEGWDEARFLMPPLTQDEYRKIIEEPAQLRVMRFESEELVDELINDVISVPTSLPLLSFVLSEMYRLCILNRRSSRELAVDDYRKLRGVAGALQHRALEEYERDKEAQPAIRRIVLRMVSIEGMGEATRRRVSRSELVYRDHAESEIVNRVIGRFIDARLLVADKYDDEPIVEPAHDALVRGWPMIIDWLRSVRDNLPIARAFTYAAEHWRDSGLHSEMLWDSDPRLPLIEEMTSVEPFRDLLKLNAIEEQFLENSRFKRRKKAVQRITVIALVLAIVVMAGVAVTFLSTQTRERDTTAKLLERMTQIGEIVDGPHQVDALFIAIDAASISQDQFAGRVVPFVRGGLIRALTRVREIDVRDMPGAQATWMLSSAGGRELMLVYRRDNGDEKPSPLVATLLSTENVFSGRDIIVNDPPLDARPCWSAECLILRYRDHTIVLSTDGTELLNIPGINIDDEVSVDISRLHQSVFVLDRSNRLRLFKFNGQGPIASKNLGPGKYEAISISRDGKRLFAFGGSGLALVMVADLRMSRMRSISLDKDRVALSSDGSFIIYPGGDGLVMRYDVDKRAESELFRHGNDRISGIFLAPNDRTVAITNDTNGSILVFRMGESEPAYGGVMFAGKQPKVGFNSSGGRLYANGYLDRKTRVYDLAGTALPQVKIPEKKVQRLALCGERLYWGTDEGVIGSHTFDGRDRMELGRVTAPVRRIACNDEISIASLDGDRNVDLWPISNNGGSRVRLNTQGISITDINSFEGTTIVANDSKKIYKVAAGNPPIAWFDLDISPARIAMNRKNSMLAAGTSGAAEIQLVGVDPAFRTAPFEAHAGMLFDLAFLPWSDRLVSVGVFGGATSLSLSVWDTSGKLVSTVEAHKTIATALAIDPINRIVATGGSDGAVRLWDDKLNKVGPDIMKGSELIQALAFSRDATVLAASDNDEITLTGLSDWYLLSHACGRAMAHTRVKTGSSDSLEHRVKAVCERHAAKDSKPGSTDLTKR